MNSPTPQQPISYPLSSWTTDIWDQQLAREIDHASTTALKMDPLALMETAGRAIAKLAIERGAESHPVIILAGLGNNGGDGLVAARVLNDADVEVSVYIVTNDPGKTPSPQFCRQRDTLQAMGVAIHNWQPRILACFSGRDPIIIDAVTGIGFNPPCGGSMLQALTEANSIARSLVIAVDIPSGMDANDGTAVTAPLPADETITFGHARPIHRLMPSAMQCGQVNIADIGFPREAINQATSRHPVLWREVDAHGILAINPWSNLSKNAHKYDRGHILVIGGSDGKIGAPILTALAALRGGAGWCSVALPPSQSPSDMSLPQEVTVESFFDGATIHSGQLEEFLTGRKVHAVIIGPGWISQLLDTQTILVLRKFTQNGGYVVLDAGALHQVADLIVHDHLDFNGRLLLTPHPGEWLKLQATPSAPPLSPDGLIAASALARRYGAHILYKNAAPVILDCSGSTNNHVNPALICSSGTSVLARAGSGDVLCGIIGAHLAIGCQPSFSMARAYTLLSRAAWMAAQDVGEDSVIASDILQRLGIASRI